MHKDGGRGSQNKKVTANIIQFGLSEHLSFFAVKNFLPPVTENPAISILFKLEKAVKENFEDMMKEAARRFSALKYETEKLIDIC